MSAPFPVMATIAIGSRYSSRALDQHEYDPPTDNSGVKVTQAAIDFLNYHK